MSNIGFVKNSPNVIPKPSHICNKVSNFISSVLPLIKVEIVEQGKAVTLADCDYYSGTKKHYEHMKVLRLMRRKHKRMLRKKEV